MKVKLIAILITALFVVSCARSPYKLQAENSPQPKLETAYDYQLLDNQYRATSMQELTQSLVDADVVFIGEYHGNHASHMLEMKILSELFKANKLKKRPTVLSLEMFNRDQQEILDKYLANKIGERYLIEKTLAWGNYKASYRPLVEFAKRYQLPVIASNAPADIVRCIGRQGADYFEKLTSVEKALIAKKPIEGVEGYDTKFFNLMSASNHTPSSRQKNSYLAQLTRDNTMADSIQKALSKEPSAQVIHMNGNFHSENHLGTVGALKKLMPNLKIRVVTPIHAEKLAEQKKKTDAKDDFYYVLNPQPTEFVDKEFMRETYKKMFSKSKEKAKSCK